MHRVTQFLTVKTVDEEKRELSGWASRKAVDRMGDVVEPSGAVFSAAGVPLLVGHDPNLPVGRVKFGKPTAQGIPFTATIARVSEPGTLKDRVDAAWQSVKYGIIDRVSIGFRVLDGAVESIATGLRYLKFEILELSLVSVPASEGAAITGFKTAARKPGVVYIGPPKKTVHVAKYGPVKTAQRVVRLTPAEITRGKILAESKAREDEEAEWRGRMGLRPAVRVVRITAEAKRRGEIEDAARAELAARQRERLNR